MYVFLHYFFDPVKETEQNILRMQSISLLDARRFDLYIVKS